MEVVEMNDNIVNEIYDREVVETVVRNVKRLMNEHSTGMMELQFKKGALVIVNINTDKEGSREILNG